MADNVTANAGSGGSIFATDEAAGAVHHPITKLEWGPDGTFNLVDDATGKRVPVKVGEALPAGTNNIGDVDVLTLPALVAGTANIGDVDVLTLPALPAGTNNIGDVDVLTLPALPAGTNNIGDVDVLTIAAGDNNIGNVDVVTLPNVTLAAGTNTNEVVGDAAHDAAVAGNPLLQGGRASAAAPTDVDADGDAVRAWFLRNGARATVITAAGALIGGDATNGLDVDVVRLPALVAGTANIGDVDVLTLPALPAGTNNIGDVDILTIAAGDNNIGNVDIVTLPALPAGTNNIGDVDVLTLPALPAGTNNIGDVDVLSVVPGTGATALGKAIDSAAGATDTGVAVLAIRDDSLSALTPVETDYVPLRVNSTGALHVTGGGGGTQYAVDDAAGATPTGTVALVVRKDTGATLAGTDGDVTALQVDAAGALRVTGGGGGTEYVVDAVAPAAPTGATFVMERDDALSALTEVQGDWTNPRSNANGALWTTVDGTVAVSGPLTDSQLRAAAVPVSGTVSINAIPAGTNNIGDVDVLSLPALVAGTANIGDVDVLTLPALPAGTNNIGDVDVLTLPNVTLAAGTNTNEVVGDAAHDAAVSGNPLLQGGRASAAAPTDVDADGDAVRSWHLRNGAQATVITAAGALIGGDAANGLDVDVIRLPALVAGTANIGDVDVLTLPALPAGTNNIGDVDVLTIAAGDNNIGNVDIVTMPTVTIASNSSVNVAQINGVTTTMGNGVSGTGVQRVTIASDSTGQVKLAANSGVDIGDVDVASVVPGTGASNLGKAEDAVHTSADVGVYALAVRDTSPAAHSGADGDYESLHVNDEGGLWTTLTPSVNGGLSIFRSLDIDESEEEVKATAGTIYGGLITNTATTTRWIKFYNATEVNVTVGATTPVITWGIPGNATDDIAAIMGCGAMGIAFSTAICVAATTGFADADTGAPGANDVIINLFYK